MISGEYRTLSQFERRAARFRSYLLGRTAICGALTLGIAAGIAPRAAKAGPQGSVVVGGAVDMQQAGTHTEFTQHTQTAILNHNSFDIKVNESVNFAQPNTSALAVNRVVGNDLPTSIAGKLTANGNVWVLNPSGVAVQGTAQVNVGGLVATTAGISDEAIMAGQRSFAGAPDGSAVTNAGSIAAGDGSVVLVAPVVSNSGTITADGSDVALGAGSGFTVDFDGDGLTRFEVTPGNGVSLSNTGTISAQGGAAYLSAASAEAVQTAVVSIGGKVEATRIEDKGGVIVISGGDKGVTEVSGEIDASQAAGDGGRVIVTGDLVDVKGTAQIDASGAEDGGQVQIGGAFQGGAIASDVLVSAGAPATTPLPTARRTAVRAGATIAADAGTQGDGGEVIVWADEATGFRGAISARGGARGGDGGFAEVSGKTNLTFDGEVDLGATAGQDGVLLLDPLDITIANNAPPNGDDEVTDDDEILFDDDSGTSFTISNEALERAVAEILLQATQDILVTVDVNASADLTLEAGRNIALGNNVDLETTGNLTLIADAVFGDSLGTGTVTFGANASLSGVDLALATGEAVELRDITATGNLSVTTSNDAIIQNGTLVVTGTTTLNAGTAVITLGDDANDFGGAVSATGSNILLDDINSITLGNIGASGTLSVEAGDDITDSGATVAGEGINVTGATTLIPGTGNGDEIVLDDAVNDFGGTVLVTGTPDVVTISDANTLTVGAISADVSITLGAGTTIDIVGAQNADSVTLQNITAGNGIGVGTATVDGFQISDAELDLVTGDVTFDADGAIDVDDVTTSENVVLDSSGGTVSFGGAGSSFGGTLTVNAGDTVSQSAGISVTGVTDVNAAGHAVTLGEATNDFGARVDVAGTDVSLGDGNALTLGDIDATSNLTVSAGSIADSGAAAEDAGVNVTGTTSLTATTTITLDDAVNDFGGAVSASGTSVELTDANAIELGATSADSLTVQATDDVTQSGALTVTGNTSVTSTDGGITLDDPANDFAGPLAGTADFTAAADKTIIVRDANDISVLTAIAERFELSADNAFEDAFDAAFASTLDSLLLEDTDGSDVTVGLELTELNPVFLGVDDLTLVTTGAITVDGLDLSTLALTLDAGGAVVFSDAGVPALVGADLASLTVLNSASVTQSASVDVSGATDITSAGGVSLGGANDFSTVAVAAIGQDVVLNDVSAIVLGGITSSTLTVTAGGTITDTAGQKIDVTGTTSLQAESGGDFFDIELDNDDAADAHSFGGAVTASGEDIEINAAGAFDLAGITTNAAPAGDEDTTIDDGNNGDFTLRAGGTITDSAAANIAGDLDLTAESFASPGTFFDIVLDGAGAGTTLSGTFSASGEDIRLIETSGNVVEIGTVIARNSVADGTLVPTPAQGAGSFELFATGGATDGSAGSITADAELFVSGVGNAVDFTFDNEDVHSVAQITSNIGSGTRNVTLNNERDIVIGREGATLNLVGALDVSAEGTITQANNRVLSNGLTLTASNDDGTDFFDIRMDNAANEFSGAISLEGEDVTLVNALAGGSTLAAITTHDDASNAGSGVTVDPTISNGNDGDLTISSAGDIVQQGGTAITVAGLADFTAPGNIVLGEANDFSISTVNASGVNVTLNDVNAIGLGEVTATGNLTVTAGGAITDTVGQNIEVTGATSITTSGDAVTLDSAANDFGGAVDVDTGTGTEANVTLVDANALILGAVRANNLTLTAGGQIDDRAAGNVIATGAASLTAQDAGGATLFDIGLIGAGNDIQGVFDATGRTVMLSDTSAVKLGAISADALGIFADGGAITDTDLRAIQVAGDTVLIAAFGGQPITLDNSGVGSHGFGTNGTGVLGFLGSDVTIQAGGAVRLGPAQASVTTLGTTTLSVGGALASTLTLTADGAVSDTGLVSVTGAAGITTTGDAVTLDNATNNFGGAVSVDTTNAGGVGAAAVTLVDTNAIALGAITGSSLDVTAGGAITDVDNTVISVTGATALTALSGADFFDIRLDGIDADGTDRPHLFSATSPFNATGEDISIAEADGFQLGTVTANAGDGAADPTISGNLGTLLVSTGGPLTQSGILTVPGRATFAAAGNAITLGQANLFGGAVDAAGSNITLRDADAIELGDIDATANLTVTAGTTIDDGAAVGADQDVNVTGLANLSATGNITLDDVNNDFSTVDADGAAITLNDLDAIGLGEITATGSLTVTAGGTITDTAGQKIDVTGTTSLLAESGGDFFDIELDNDDAADVHSFGGAVTASGEDIEINASGAFDIAGITTNGAAAGDEDTKIDDGNNGDFTLRAGGTITDSAAANIAGDLDLTAESFTTPGTFFDIVLDGAGGVGTTVSGTFSASGEDIKLVETSGTIVEIGTVIARDSVADNTLVPTQGAGSFQLLATGGATDGTAGSITADGGLFVSGSGVDFIFDEEDAHSVGLISAGSGTGNVTLNNQRALVIGEAGVTLDLAGALDVSAEGTITQASAVLSNGLTLTASNDGGDDFFDILMNNAANEFSGAISLTGEDVTLVNSLAGGSTLAAITTHDDASNIGATVDPTIATGNDGDLTISSAGDIVQQGGTAITVAGLADFTAPGNIVLGEANDFSAAGVDADGADITLNDVNAIGLGEVTATGNLTVTAGGAITDSVGQNIEVTGTTSLSATDGVSTFFDIVLDNASLADAHDFAGAVSASGQDIQITDVNALTLDDVTTHVGSDPTLNDPANDGDLTLRAGAGPLISTGIITVAGDLDARAENLGAGGNFSDISLGVAGGSVSIGGTFSAVGEDIHLVESSGNAVQIRSVTANSDASADGELSSFAGAGAGSFLLQSSGANAGTSGAITVSGTLGLDGAGSDFLFGNSVDGVGLHSVPNLNVIAANDVTLSTSTPLTLTDGFAPFVMTGTLTLLSRGTISQTAAISVGGLDATAFDPKTNPATDDDDFLDIVLDSATNSLTGEISASGEDISITNSAGTTDLGTVTAHDDSGGTVDGGTGNGDLTILSTGGAIIDDAAGAITVPGTTSLTAQGGAGFFDIVLDNADTHDFDSDGSGDAVNATGADIVLDDASAIVLGAIDANAGGSDATVGLFDDNGDGVLDGSDIASKGDLTVRAGGTITDTGSTIDVAGRTRLEARAGTTLFDIALDTGVHDFDSNASLTGDRAGDAEDEVDAVGRNVTLVDSNAIALGDVAASGDLTVLAGGSITDTDSLGDLEAVTVGGTTSLTAQGGAGFFDIVLDNADTHDFDSDGSGDAVNATGADIVLDDASAIVLGAIDANAGGSDATVRLFDDNGDGVPDGSDIASKGDLTVRAGGTITDTGSTIDVAGRTRLEARAGTTLFDIALDTGVHDFDSNASLTGDRAGDAEDEVDAVGRNVTLVDSNAIALGDVAASGDLTVLAGGSITDTDSLGDLEAVTVGGTTSLTAQGGAGFFDIVLDNADTHDFDSDGSGDAVNATGADIVLDDASAIVLGAIDANAGGSDATVGLFDDNGDGVPDGSDIASKGDLTVRAGGTITDTGSTIDVAGRTRLEARAGTTLFDIALDTGVHDFDSNASLTGDRAGDAEDEVDAVGRNVTLVDSNAIALGDVAASGDLTVLAGGSITDTDSLGDLEAVTVGGTTSLTAQGGAGFFDIVLDNADTHDFDSDGSGDAVNATGADIVLDDASAIVLGAIDANAGGSDATVGLFDDNGDGVLDGSDIASKGDLTVRAGGTITDTGSTIDVAGRTRLEARAGTTLFDIALDTGVHDFDSNASLTGDRAGDAEDEVDAVGRNVTLVDSNAIALGDVAASGDLTVLAGGSITDTDSLGDLEAVTVGGTTSLTAQGGAGFFDIALDNADTHDFDSDGSGDAVNATGADIVLDDASAIVLGAIDANAGGSDATVGLFDDNGDGVLDGSDIASKGDLTVRAGGTITDTGSTIDVAGRTRLEARAGTTLFDIALDTGVHDFDSNASLTGDRAGDAEDEVDAVGRNVTLVDSNAIALGDVAASGDLTVLAGGSITDTDSLGDLEAVTVGGTTSLTAQGGAGFFDIVLDNADTHDFDSDGSGDAVNATGADIVLDDASAIVLGAIDANAGGSDATVRLFDDNGDGVPDGSDIASKGDLTVRAGGTITDTGSTIDVAGRTRLEARAGTTLFDIALDTGVHDFDSNASLTGDRAGDAEDEVDAVGRNVTLVDSNAIALGDVAASGDLTVLAGGSITDTDSLGDLEAVTVGGTTSLTAQGGAGFFDIALDNADTHDFDSDGSGDAVNATGADIVLDDASAIVLGAIDANAGGSDATVGLFDDNGDGVLDGSDIASKGDLTVRAGGTITDTGSTIDVAGRTRLEARAGTTLFDIALDTGVHDFDSNASLTGDRAGDAEDEVDAVGRNVTLVDSNAIALGDVAASGDLTVLAGGSITDTDSLGDLEAVTVGGTTSLTAQGGAGFFDIVLDNADTHDFDSDGSGDAVNATGADIVLDDASAIVLGAIDANAGGSDATVRLFDDNGDGVPDGSDIASKGDLTVRAGGTITDTGSTIDVAGRTRLEARAGTTLFDIALDTGVHDFDSNASLTGDRAGDAEDEVDAVGRNVTLVDSNAIALGDVAASGDLTVLAGGSITDTDSLGDLEAVTVGGTTSLTAQGGAGFFDIVLDNADTHDFDSDGSGDAVNATGADIVLDDASAIVLGAIDANAGGSDATVGLFDDNGDGVLDGSDIASKGDLTVRAGGTITDTGSTIDVAGRTRLEARAGTTLFDIALDTGVHDFDSNASLTGDRAGDAEDEVDAVGRNVTLVDSNAIALGDVAASGDLTVLAGGSITDTDSLGDLEAVTVGGTTSLTAQGGAGFFDIVLDNADTHDLTGAVNATGEGIVISDLADLTIASITATSDGQADATVPDSGRGHGSIDLTVNSGDFFFDPAVDVDGNAVPLQADGNISLTAPAGSFGVVVGRDVTRRQLQDGLTFRSTSGNILLEFANGFVVPDDEGPGPFTLDAAAGTSTLIIGNPADPDREEFLGIGTTDFLDDAQRAGFNPLFVTADIGDAEIFRVTGNLALTTINRNTLTVRVQNTSEVPNQGDGTTVAGTTTLSGDFAALTMFGTFNGAARSVSSLQGFTRGGGFVIENGNTVNGCVIGLPSSCQPIGSLSLSLDFPDGLLLGVRFIDPDEDLDDPFTNRGDEEEWE